MKLILVRHGETYENVNKICQGHYNSQLTEKGIQQAKNAAEALKDIKIDIALSSDLDRALNTCKEILKFHSQISLKTDIILREQAKGIYEGKLSSTRDKYLKENNILFQYWKPEGGESLVEVWKKVVDYIEKLKVEHQNETILLVSHGGPISCILAYLHGKNIDSYKEFSPKNTAISIINLNRNIEFETLNNYEHLE